MNTERNKCSISPLRLLARVSVIGLALTALSSCGPLNQLGHEVRSMYHDARIIGRVDGSEARPVKVLVYKKNPTDGSFAVADSTSPNALGDFVFLMPRNETYFIAAVEAGKKQNLVSIYGGSEMKALPKDHDLDPKSLVLDLKTRIDRQSPATRELERALENWKPAPDAGSSSVAIACGDLASLDDPAFDPQAGEKGLWAPITSAKRYGLGVYFLERYDPKKIPVIFVHGIGGTPRSFKPIIESLDHRRYQAWVYSYPSGLPIDSAAQGLADLTDRLQRHYGFKKVHVVAHSMGGLVARRSVQRTANDLGKNYIASLTTISTPWNGVPFATVGVLGLPVSIPCWTDLRPGSKFIHKILNDPLPMPHLLIATEKSSFRITLPKRNDGSVSVASQMDERAVSQSTKKELLSYDHTQVLEAEETHDALNAFLSREGRPLRLY